MDDFFTRLLKYEHNFFLISKFKTNKRILFEFINCKIHPEFDQICQLAHLYANLFKSIITPSCRWSFLLYIWMISEYISEFSNCNKKYWDIYIVIEYKHCMFLLEIEWSINVSQEQILWGVLIILIQGHNSNVDNHAY